MLGGGKTFFLENRYFTVWPPHGFVVQQDDKEMKKPRLG
jgi:hypothetical protein